MTLEYTSVDWKGSSPAMRLKEQPTSRITSQKTCRRKKRKKKPKHLKQSLCDLATARSGEQMLLFTKCIQAEAFLVSTDL